MTSKPKETDARGIPLKSPYPASPSVAVLYGGLFVVFGGIGIALAYLAAYRPESKRELADAKIALLAQYDLGWLYLGISLLKILQLPLSIVLGQGRKASKVGLPDQHVYKVMGSEGSKLGYVLMEGDGDHGTFNRAQRAWMNYHENFPTVAVLYVAASWVFPFEAFACVAAWAASACVSAVGYCSSPDGRMRGRLPGYLGLTTLQGMVLIAAYKALSVDD